MADRKTFFVDVLLPLPLPGRFTYRVPQEMENEIAVGKRVVVPFGKNKIYAGLVVSIHENAPASYIVKYISGIIDERPIVNALQLQFWLWMSNYYMCSEGEVMLSALPSAFRLSSETKIILNPDFDGDISVLNENEILIAQALYNKPELEIAEVQKITGLQKTFSLIKNLREKNVILVQEEVNERYKPKTETHVRLTETYRNEENLKTLFDTLERKAVKQLKLLMAFLHYSRQQKTDALKRADLLKLADSSAAHLQALVKKEVFEIFEQTTSRLQTYAQTHEVEQIQLSDVQAEALQKIHNSFAEKSVTLLHGVTSSGKTELYIKLIEEQIKNGKQVLYLLPEIALTAQIINRLRKYFGDKVGVYHSKYSDSERVEIWNAILPDENKKGPKYQIILGARSALFLPFENLGLIIIDEEHETTFKQFDPAPRYNARDSAIYLAQQHHAKVLLGSATPSIESYFNATTGKYGFVELLTRYNNMQLPEVMVADLKEETRRKTMSSHFSSLLMKYIEEALANKEQIILFQNRRGFSVRLECEICNFMPECKNCDVTLTYHKHINQLKCHYCGYSIHIPEKCPKCGNPSLKMKGFGTEKIEDELSIFFPNARIARMDLDTTRSKNAYHDLISDFEEKKIDILVGTQMVTKGLDFDNVSVVGILNADNMITFPDFRSYERSFQLMSQVSGRAGRKNKRGTVIIQTFNPYYQVIRDVIDHNYTGMVTSQLPDRQVFKYPPYYRLIELTVKHKDPDLLNEAASELGKMLRKHFDKRVLGPEFPLISRIQNQYLKTFLIKLERNSDIGGMKKILHATLLEFSQIPKYKAVRVVIDVDPQ